MKATTFFLLSFFATAGICAQDKRQQNLQDLITAENEFAALAQKTSFGNGFVQNLDSAGIVFRGAEPVNGLSFYRSLASNNQLLFKWYPVQAELAAGADMGFTTGPYIMQLNNGKDTLAVGNYFSIWRKNAAGMFKVLFDGGITHSTHAEAVNYGKIAGATVADAGKLSAGVSNGKALTSTDNKFVSLAATNLQKAYETYMADQCYLLRADKPTGIEKAGNLQTIKALNLSSCQFTNKGSFYSAGNNWCFTYGMVNAAGRPASEATGYFVHVWQNQKGGWKIIADVLQFVKTDQ